MRRRRTNLLRAVVAGGAVLGIFLVGCGIGRCRAQDGRPEIGGAPASRNAAAAAPARAAEAMQFDLGCDTTSGGRLLRLLARDRITVAWADTGAEGEMTVRVTMPVSRFQELFRGMLVKREVARSSYDGFATERFIERYVIPRRYRGILRWVRLPDPQIE